MKQKKLVKEIISVLNKYNKGDRITILEDIPNFND